MKTKTLSARDILIAKAKQYRLEQEKKTVELIKPGVFKDIISAIVENAARDQRQAKGKGEK